MNCAKCGAETKVVTTHAESAVVHRKRQCVACKWTCISQEHYVAQTYDINSLRKKPVVEEKIVVAKHGAVRPLSEQSSRVLDYVRDNPGVSKKVIAEALNIDAEAVRCLLYRARKRGELIADTSRGAHKVTYTLGDLMPRPVLKKNRPPEPPKPKPRKSRAAHNAPSPIKQTKPWKPPTKKEVEIIYPANYKYTVQNSNYEPLVKHDA